MSKNICEHTWKVHYCDSLRLANEEKRNINLKQTNNN